VTTFLRVGIRSACATALLVVASGCGSNPPCTIDLATVDAARSRAMDAEQKLENAEAQKDRLREQIEAAEAERASLEARITELEGRIQEPQP